MSIFDWADRVDADPPFLRDRLPEILGDRPWWDTPHSIRIRRDRRTLAEIEESFRQAARDAYRVHRGDSMTTNGFIVPEPLRATLAEILEHERSGRPWAIHYDPPLRSWARRTARRLAALLERFAG